MRAAYRGDDIADNFRKNWSTERGLGVMTFVLGSVKLALRVRQVCRASAIASILGVAVIVVIAMIVAPQSLHAQTKRPNIVVIWGDDIGQSNLSTYTGGLMGYRTPNIDRIANEGTIDQALETLQSAHGK